MMIIKKGDIIICALTGDYGKPRPAVVVQSDLFNQTHASRVICPITSYLVEADLFRILILPEKQNGLTTPSQIMIDKLTTIKNEKISRKIGSLSFEKLQQVNNALKLWLDLND